MIDSWPWPTVAPTTALSNIPRYDQLVNDRFDELLKSPYDDEPTMGRTARIVIWSVVGLVVLVAVVFVLVRSTTSVDYAEGDPAPPPSDESTATSTSSSTTSIPDIVGVVDAPEGLGPEPQFDTSTFGEQTTVGESTESPPSRDTFMRGFLDEGAIFTSIGAVGPDGATLFRFAGTIVDPFAVGYAGPGMCVGLWRGGGGSSECMPVGVDVDAYPLFSGHVGSGITAWGGLSDQASVATLVVDDQVLGWTRPVASVAVFEYEMEPGTTVRMDIYDVNGQLIGTADRHPVPPPATPNVEPIEGYGDFSEQDLRTLDRAEVESALVACLADWDIEAEVGERDGPQRYRIDMDVEPEQLPTATTVLARCYLGLKIPVSDPYNADQLAEFYEASVEAAECLNEAGYEVGEPPALDEWITHPIDTRWDPWRILMVKFLRPSDFEAAIELCQT